MFEGEINVTLRAIEKRICNVGEDLEQALARQAHVLEETTKAMRSVNDEVAQKKETLSKLRTEYQELLRVHMAAKSVGGVHAGSPPASVTGPSVSSPFSINLRAIQTPDGVRADTGIAEESGGGAQAGSSSPTKAAGSSVVPLLISKPEIRADIGIREESGSGAQAASPPLSVAGPLVSSVSLMNLPGTGTTKESGVGARANPTKVADSSVIPLLIATPEIRADIGIREKSDNDAQSGVASGGRLREHRYNVKDKAITKHSERSTPSQRRRRSRMLAYLHAVNKAHTERWSA